jgi:hypothetical protein
MSRLTSIATTARLGGYSLAPLTRSMRSARRSRALFGFRFLFETRQTTIVASNDASRPTSKIIRAEYHPSNITASSRLNNTGTGLQIKIMNVTPTPQGAQRGGHGAQGPGAIIAILLPSGAIGHLVKIRGRTT